MKPNLRTEEIIALHGAMLPLYNANQRGALLEGLSPQVRGLLGAGPGDAGQLFTDLHRLNEVDPPDDHVPMLDVLQIAKALTQVVNAPAVKPLEDAELQLRRKLATQASAQPVQRPAWGGHIDAEVLYDPNVGSRTLASIGLSPEGTRWSDETPESVVGIDARVDAAFFTLALQRLAQVGRIWVPALTPDTPENGFRGFGTLWMITPTLAMTARHVLTHDRVRTDEQVKAAAERARIHWARTPPASGLEPADVEGVELLVHHHGEPKLDFAIVRLPEARDGFFTCAENTFLLGKRPYEAATIPQYPQGVRLRVGIRDNLVHRATDTRVLYVTDTDVGSSGSPVCDDGWTAFALHRATTSERNVGTQLSAIWAWLAANGHGDLLAEIRAEGRLVERVMDEA